MTTPHTARVYENVGEGLYRAEQALASQGASAAAVRGALRTARAEADRLEALCVDLMRATSIADDGVAEVEHGVEHAEAFASLHRLDLDSNGSVSLSAAILADTLGELEQLQRGAQTRVYSIHSIAGAYAPGDWEANPTTNSDHYQYGIDALNHIDPFNHTPGEDAAYEQHHFDPNIMADWGFVQW